MLNTCSIGRRWKPREGWSRPVLTGERGTLFPTRLLGRVSSCGGFFRWMARSIVSCGHDDDTGEAFLFASVVRFPDRHDRNRGMVPFAGRPVGVGRCIGFAVVMAQVRRPVPFRTRKLRPGRGDGTALERVWESSTPPHSTSGFPSSVTLREPPFFVFWFVFPATLREPLFLFPHTGVSSAHWRFLDAGRTAGGMIPPPAGGFGTPEGPWAGGFLHPLGVPGRWGIPGISGELPALIRWWNRLGNYALFRTQTLRRIEQNHVSRQSDGPAGRRPELA